MATLDDLIRDMTPEEREIHHDAIERVNERSRIIESCRAELNERITGIGSLLVKFKSSVDRFNTAYDGMLKRINCSQEINSTDSESPEPGQILH